MLTVSYSQCVADPTYCDAGKLGGAKLVYKLAIKPNQPIPLRQVFPHVTLAEALWCIRVVRKSQREEARKTVWRFIEECVALFPELNIPALTQYIENRCSGARVDVDVQLHLSSIFEVRAREQIVYKLAAMAVSDRIPSQIAINIATEAIRQGRIRFPNRDIEAELREAFMELIE